MKRPPHIRLHARRRNAGAALVIGLLLLVVLTLLAISGMSTSTLELQMAGNMQYGENAFQAAEYGIERGFRSGKYDTTTPTIANATAVHTGQPETYAFRSEFDPNSGVTIVKKGGFSMGVNSGYSSYHFNITSTGTSSRNATSTQVQSFYVVGPSGT